MKLHEYQAKELLRMSGLPVPKGRHVRTVSQVQPALESLNTSKGVVKAQVFTGGRGKAGGVKLFSTVQEAEAVTKQILGMTLVTHQSGPKGILVESVLVESAVQFTRELYVAIVVDRTRGRPVIMLSPEGGIDIEEVAARQPHKIMRLYPEVGEALLERKVAEAAHFLGLDSSMEEEFYRILQRLFWVFQERDCAMLEINPLALKDNGQFILLDCKMHIDDNAVFRQKHTGGDAHAELSPAEIEAGQYGLSYIQLDGNIGCMVNGAGLAMATMDIILAYGGTPANFLDVGGGATESAVTKAFEIVTSDRKVKAILVNIFGGIMKCDVIARGVINAVRNTGLKVPLVVRLAGTNMEEGRRIIEESKLNIIFAEDMASGAKAVVESLGKGN